MVTATGAGYVIWSISWWGYHLDAPLSSPDSIVTAEGGPASPGLTATRDLIGAIASACQAAGIRFMMYYHTGDEDSAWWPYQDWPATFATNGTGDRSTFFGNWIKVVSEIGTRYGTNLDGFLFDDGMVLYYPAAYEQLHAAARSGNPGRLVSWNNWILPRVTDFQDVWFGEGSAGQSQAGSAAPGGNGVFTSGPYQGLLQHGMFTMDGDWGVHTQNTKIATNSGMTSSGAIGWAASAVSRRVPISFDLMMYEDGTVAASDLAILNDVRQAVRGTAPSVPTGTTTINDTDAGIAYAGTWTYGRTAMRATMTMTCTGPRRMGTRSRTPSPAPESTSSGPRAMSARCSASRLTAPPSGSSPSTRRPTPLRRCSTAPGISHPAVTPSPWRR